MIPERQPTVKDAPLLDDLSAEACHQAAACRQQQQQENCSLTYDWSASRGAKDAQQQQLANCSSSKSLPLRCCMSAVGHRAG